MSFKKMISRRFLITLVTLLVIGTVAGVAIFLAKGYSISPTEKRIVGTGIISITSSPDAASVYLDGHLTTATDATISNLQPKEYTVKVLKEGFIPWEKKVEVKEGLVTDLKVTLFPAIPTIYPLTFIGVKNSVLSPDGSKLAFIVPSGKKAGIWVWTMSADRPIAFARSSEPHQIAQNGLIDYTDTTLRWSPDSSQVLASKGNNNYLLDDGKLNTEPKDITPILNPTLSTWEEDIKAKDEARVLTIKNMSARKIASDSAILKWSPDETKFIFRDKPFSKEEESGTKLLSGLKTYDLEENIQYSLPEAKLHFWLPDSRHVVLVEDESVSIVDFDGTNKAIIYAGKFEDSFVFTWPDSSRLVIISSFPTPTASEPNLYGINLK